MSGSKESANTSARNAKHNAVSSILTLVLILTAGIGGALYTVLPSAQSAHAANSSPQMSGPGEYWTLTFYGSVPASLSTLETEWNSYYAQGDFQTYKAEFGWNLIRIGFCFSNLASYTDDSTCPSAALNAQSTSGAVPDLSWLGEVVSIAHQNGMLVDLTDFDFTGQAPPSAAAMAVWESDWTALATYFTGNSDIALFQFGNELEHSTTTNGYLSAVMAGIRGVDPSVTLAMWEYSPSTSTGAASYAKDPDFTIPSNVWNAVHTATYIDASTCQTDSVMSQVVDTARTYASTYGYTPYFGEINAQFSACNSVSEYLLGLLNGYGIPYILWGYSEYRSNWDAILGAMGSPEVTTTSTATSVSSSLLLTTSHSSSTETITKSTTSTATKPITTTSLTTISTSSKSTNSVGTTPVSAAVTFSEKGLPIGTVWSVTFDGTILTSAYSSITFTDVNPGVYLWNAADPASNNCTYTSSPSSGSFSVPAQESQAVAFSSSCPPSYLLTVLNPPGGGGTTDPTPGTYSMTNSSRVTVDALPQTGWRLDYWVVNGVPAGNGTELGLDLIQNYSAYPVFAESPSPPDTASVSFFSGSSASSPLTIDGQQYGLPVTFSWAIGTDHNVTAPSTVSINNGTRGVFTGWVGSTLANTPSLDLVVSGDTLVSPIYETQYLTSFNFVDCNGNTIAPQLVTLQTQNGWSSSLGKGTSKWLNANTVYDLGSAYWDNVEVFSSSNGPVFTATSSRILTLRLPVCAADIKVSDIFGMPVTGATVLLSFPNGTQLSSNTNNQGIAAFPESPEVPYAATVQYLGVSYQVPGSSMFNSSQDVTLVLSYPLLYAIAAFVLLVSGAAAGMIYRRRKLNQQNEGEMELFLH
jgi:hypothetical protein